MPRRNSQQRQLYNTPWYITQPPDYHSVLLAQWHLSDFAPPASGDDWSTCYQLAVEPTRAVVTQTGYVVSCVADQAVVLDGYRVRVTPLRWHILSRYARLWLYPLTEYLTALRVHKTSVTATLLDEPIDALLTRLPPLQVHPYDMRQR
jgi:hypothetical protein